MKGRMLDKNRDEKWSKKKEQKTKRNKNREECGSSAQSVRSRGEREDTNGQLK